MSLDAATLAAALDNRALHLILLPTEACNFRCTYCYESFALGRMRRDVVEGVKALLTRRADELEQLSLSWFGGEPLLAFDLIEEIGGHALELANEHPHLALEANVTTNAWKLDRRTFERLLDLRVSQFHVALDGPREIHDRERVLAGGGGTFERIWANLRAARELDRPFQIVLRLHVDRENHERLPELVERCRDEFGDDPRYSIYFKPLSRYGGPGDETLPVLEDGERERILAQLEACARGLAERSSSTANPLASTDGAPAMVGAPATAPRTLAVGGGHAPTEVCYASKANSLVVRADGRLSKCTVALDAPENDVGRLNADGTLTIDRARQKRWLRGLASGDTRELFCPLLGLVDVSRGALAAKA